MRAIVPYPAGPTHFRAHARLRVELLGTITAPGLGAREVRVRDLGVGGAGLEIDVVGATEPLLAAEALVTLSLRAPTLWDPLALSGRLAWARSIEPGRPRRAGICFDHADPGKLLALFHLLGAHAADH